MGKFTVDFEKVTKTVDSWMAGWKEAAKAQEMGWYPPGVGNGLIYAFFGEAIALKAIALLHPAGEQKAALKHFYQYLSGGYMRDEYDSLKEAVPGVNWNNAHYMTNAGQGGMRQFLDEMVDAGLISINVEALNALSDEK